MNPNLNSVNQKNFSGRKEILKIFVVLQRNSNFLFRKKDCLIIKKRGENRLCEPLATLLKWKWCQNLPLPKVIGKEL